VDPDAAVMTPPPATTEPPEALIAQLQASLAQQLDLARKSDFRGLEKLAAEAGSLIAEIEAKKDSLSPELTEKLAAAGTLLAKLALTVSAARDNTEKQLKKVSKGKRTMQAYRHPH
jgi:hypothetical protein